MTNPATVAPSDAEGLELKPCPFCGGVDGDLVETFTRATETLAIWAVECERCGAERASDESAEEARNFWNTRASSPTPLAGETGEKVRGWLVAMTKQGEDQIWRGAEKALATFEALSARLAAVEEALREYGQHRINCRILSGYPFDHATAQPCTCGFSAALSQEDKGGGNG